MAAGHVTAEIERLQVCFDDLSKILALPESWVDADPSRIVQSVLDSLLDVLSLDLVYLRADVPAGDVSLAVVRLAAVRGPAIDPDQVGALLDPLLGASVNWPSTASINGETLTLISLPLGIREELGVLVAGVARTPFPQQTERVVLGVAANQVTIALQNVRHHAEQKRAAQAVAMNDELKRTVLERQRAEGNMWDQEALLHQLVDSIAAEVTICTPEGEIVVVNRTCLERTGRPFKGHKDWATNDLLHADDIPRVRAAWARAVETGGPYEVEVRSRRADGNYRWIHSHGFPVRDAGGRIVRWCTLHLDVHDRKVAEEAVRKLEFVLRAMVDSIAAPMSLWMPSGECEMSNRHVQEYFGTALLETKDWREAIHPDDRAAALAAWQQALRSGQTYEDEMRCRFADGTWRWNQFRGFPMRDADGTIVRWCVLQIDIHGRKQAEEALAQSERKLREIIDTIPAMAWSADADGMADFFNQHHLDYVGLPLEEMQGTKFVSTFHPDDLDRLLGPWGEMLAKGRGGEVEGRVRGADGQYRWFLFRTNPLRDAAGNVIKWFGVNIDIDDWKRAEEGVRTRDLLLNSLLDGMPTPIALLTPKGELEVANRFLVDYFGQDLEALKQWKVGDSVHPDDIPVLTAAWARAIETGQPFQLETRRRRADGVHRWFHTSGFPMRDAGGEIVRWCALQIDIDDRKQAEAALAASERELALIINAIPAMAWSADAGGGAEFVNQHYLEYVGLGLEEMRGTGWAATLHPDDIEHLVGAWQRMLDSQRGGYVEARVRRFDGEYRWFLFRAEPLRDEAGEIIKWFGVNIDIEEQKRAENALKASEVALAASERNLNLIINTIPAVAWSAYPDGAAEFFNQHYLDYVGLSLEQVRGWGWTSAVHPDDLPGLAAMWRTITDSRSAGEAEARLRRFDGAYRWFLLRAHPLYDEAGQVKKWFGVNTDIEDRKRAEETLRDIQSELAHLTRAMTMGQLTASIAHELNQPLAGIITNASTCLRMLAADPPNVAGARETARRTIRDGNRASEVITRLRALFKKRATAVEPVDLNAATKEVAALAATELQKNKVSLRLNLAESLPAVTGDRVQLQQVILNLILNAIEAMRGVGDRPRQVTIATSLDQSGHARLAVSDAGVGFDPDGVEKLFSPFYTTKGDGMGIGLSVSRTIVENHQGRLWAERNKGPGATFLFSIPCLSDGETDGDSLARPPARGSAHSMENQ